MNPLGGPKVGWRALMMFLCFSPNFVFMSVFKKTKKQKQNEKKKKKKPPF